MNFNLRPFNLFYIQVGCTKEGILNGIKVDVYNDSGCSPNESSMAETLVSIDNGKVHLILCSLICLIYFCTVYKCPNWLVTPKACKTHTCCNVYCRAPGILISF